MSFIVAAPSLARAGACVCGRRVPTDARCHRLGYLFTV